MCEIIPLIALPGSTMSTEDVMESEEAYYLRRVCGRNNARILQMVADEVGLCLPSVVDTCVYDLCSIASCTTKTMINDMYKQKDGRVSVVVNCADTTRVENGLLCCMNPSEGFWMFKVPWCFLSLVFS
jgi:hypothetical protein